MSVSHWPFYLGIFGALLTAFYMTRQVCYVFFGAYRNGKFEKTHFAISNPQSQISIGAKAPHGAGHEPRESPLTMTAPLAILAGFAILLGFLGTPAWPWFQDFLNGHPARIQFGKLFESEVLGLMALSSAVVFAGLGLGWWLYGRKPVSSPNEIDVLERIPGANQVERARIEGQWLTNVTPDEVDAFGPCIPPVVAVMQHDGMTTVALVGCEFRIKTDVSCLFMPVSTSRRSEAGQHSQNARR